MTAQIIRAPWARREPVPQPALEPKPKPPRRRRKRAGRKPVQLDLFRDWMMSRIVAEVLARRRRPRRAAAGSAGGGAGDGQ